MNDPFALIVASVVSVVGTLVSIWFKNKLEYKKENCLESRSKTGSNVYQALKYIHSVTDCDRAYVFEFHNGEHFFSGKGQQKFSCTYEFVKNGVSSEAGNSQNHRVSNFNTYMDDLISHGIFECKDVSLLEDPAFKSVLRGKGVESIVNVPIKTLNGSIIGILGIEYLDAVEDFKCDPANSDCFTFLKRQARLIGGYIA